MDKIYEAEQAEQARVDAHNRFVLAIPDPNRLPQYRGPDALDGENE